MFFTKESIKKTKGVTLIEVVISLTLITILISLLFSTFRTHLNIYESVSSYSTTSISIKETLEFIETEIDKNSIGVKIEGNTLFLGKSISNSGIQWSRANKISKNGSTLCFYFCDSLSGDYQSQPLQYDVESFTLEENNKVFFIKIQSKDGTICEKAFSK